MSKTKVQIIRDLDTNVILDVLVGRQDLEFPVFNHDDFPTYRDYIKRLQWLGYKVVDEFTEFLL